MNFSKKNDQRMWLRWRKSGAVSDRYPGSAAGRGITSCPCAGWCRPVDENVRKTVLGLCDLKHARGCDGHGNHVK